MPRFRLLTGQHVANNVDGDEVVYKRGDIVESPRDLVKRFGNEKFTRVHEDEAVAHSAQEGTDTTSDEINDNLDALSVAQLRKFATEEEIDVTGLTRKDQLIAAIRKAPK